MTTRDILELPYDQRRVIVVTDKVPTALSDQPGGRLPALPYFPNVPKALVPRLSKVQARWLVVGVAGVAGIALARAAARMHAAGEELLPVTWTEAGVLQFPVGHPRKKVAYVGHPLDPPKYIPVADFHRFLFEHKVAEAQRLIRCLGAVSVDVVREEGFDQKAGVNLGLATPEVPGVPAVDAGVAPRKSQDAGRTLLAKMRLKPTQPPHIPDGLVWMAHEPLWQELADARMESGLDSFVLDVKSTDDYGVNADFRALIAKSKLEVGGDFVKHQKTVWRLEGTFSES